MSNTLMVPNDAVAGADGKPSSTWMTQFNLAFAKVNAMANVASVAAPVPTDLPTALTAIAELQTIVSALITAANASK